jgi:hypothetical protein
MKQAVWVDRTMIAIVAVSAAALPLAPARWALGASYDHALVLASTAAFFGAMVCAALARGPSSRGRGLAGRAAVVLFAAALFVALLPLTCGA